MPPQSSYVQLNSGCSFFAGYTMTPSSGIYPTMVEKLPDRGGEAISALDEISARKELCSRRLHIM